MSDNWIILIPEDSLFVPTAASQQLAEDRLRRLAPHADEVRSQVSHSIKFHDCGVNLEKVSCPHCGCYINQGWWQDAMDQDFDGTGFKMHDQVLPCCGAKATLHGLKYYFQQGYGKYSLEAMNPDLGELTSSQAHDFEVILGCTLRVIYQHI